MSLVIHPGSVHGTVQSSPSKSYTHRALLLGLLAQGTTRVRGPLMSEDPRATLRAAEMLGGAARHEDGDVVIESSGELRAPREVIDCMNSGTSLRLLSAIVALAEGESTLTGDASLRKRPMGPLVDALSSLGARIRTAEGGRAPLAIGGPMRGGRARLPGDVSSQFVSALLLAGAKTAEGITVDVVGELKSRPYVDITIEMMREFGARVDDVALHVPGQQTYAARDYTVPGDFSTAAFALAAGALAGEVRVENLPAKSAQGDRAILDHLETLGAKVTRGERHATVCAAPLSGARIDLSDTPDLFPVLAAVAAHAAGETVFSGAAHLRFKESDRIHLMVENLRRCGVDAQEREDGAVIRGGAPVRAARGLVTEDDHRILMAMSVCALRAEGPLEVADAASYRVSYPRFVDDFHALGARLEVHEE